MPPMDSEKVMPPAVVEKKTEVQQETRDDLDQTKKAMEREAAYKPLFRRDGLETGKAELTKEDIKKLPNIDPNLEYLAIGGVDSATYNPNPKPERGPEWYKEQATLAKQYFQLFEERKLFIDFPRRELTNTLGALDVLKRLPENFEPKDIKKKLDAFGVNSVYGSHGAYNLLLALKRANLATKKAELSGTPINTDKILYDLKFGQGTAPRSRFTALGVKKEELKNETPVIRAPEKAVNKPDANIVEEAETVAEQYRKEYGRPIVINKSQDEAGNPTIVMTIDVDQNQKKIVTIRTSVGANGALSYAVIRGDAKDGRTYPTIEDAKQALAEEVKNILKSDKKLDLAARKIMKEQLDRFFDSHHILHDMNSEIESHKVTGVERYGAGKGLDFSDAQYVICMKNHTNVYVYIDFDHKTLSLRVAENVSKDLKNVDLRAIHLDEIPFVNLEESSFPTGEANSNATQEKRHAFGQKIISLIQSSTITASPR